MAKLLLKWLDESTLKLIAENQNLNFCNGKVGLYANGTSNGLIDLFKDSKIKEVGKIHKMETYSFIDGKMEGPSDGDYIETLELEQMGERFYVRAYCENSDYYLDLVNAAEKRLCLMLTNEFAKGSDYISISDVCKHENYNAVLKAALLLEKNGVIKLIPKEKGFIYRLEDAFVRYAYFLLYCLYDNNMFHANNSFHNNYADASNKEIFCGCVEFTNFLLTMYSRDRLLEIEPEISYFLPTDKTSNTPIIDTLCQMHEMEPQLSAESFADWFMESVAEKQFYAFDEGYSFLDELLKELLVYKNQTKTITTLTEEESKIVKTALHQYGNKCMLNENGEKERERIWKLEEKF